MFSSSTVLLEYYDCGPFASIVDVNFLSSKTMEVAETEAQAKSIAIITILRVKTTAMAISKGTICVRGVAAITPSITPIPAGAKIANNPIGREAPPAAISRGSLLRSTMVKAERQR